MLGPVGQLGPASIREPALKKNHFARTCAQNDFSLERHLVKSRRYLVKSRRHLVDRLWRKFILRAHELSLERHLMKLRRHLVKLDLRNARVQKRRAFVNRIWGSWSVAPLLNSCISMEAFESRHPIIILLNKHETGWSRKLQDDYPVYPVCDPSLDKRDMIGPKHI